MPISRENIFQVRKVNISNTPEYTLWEVQYSYGDNEWYDLFDDPPEWLCDLVIKELTKEQL